MHERSVLFVSNFLSAGARTRGYSEELTDRLETTGYRVIRTSSQQAKLYRLGDMLATSWHARKAVRSAHIDVFSGAAFTWAELVSLELQALGIPFVLTLRGGNLPTFGKRWPRRVGRLLRAATRVTAPSRYLSDAFRTVRDIEILPNAVDINHLSFRVRTHAEPKLIWVRAFHEIYNPCLAIEVLADVSKHYPDATLRMLGPDKDGSLALTRERARQLGVLKRVEFCGLVPKKDIPRHLAECDVFLNTTDVDNTPVSVLEAMGAGLCVVSTSAGGVPYLLDNDCDSLLVPIRDRTAMASAVERVLRDDELCRRISTSAHRRVSQWDWKPILRRWDDMLTAVTR